jgi:hypothetical protein
MDFTPFSLYSLKFISKAWSGAFCSSLEHRGKGGVGTTLVYIRLRVKARQANDSTMTAFFNRPYFSVNIASECRRMLMSYTEVRLSSSFETGVLSILFKLIHPFTIGNGTLSF